MKWALIALLLASAALAGWWFRSFLRSSEMPPGVRLSQLALTGLWFALRAAGAIWLAFA